MELSVVIPTRNRPEDLTRCLQSLLNQTQPPEEILIIDDGDLDTSFREKWIETAKKRNISLDIHKKSPPGTAASRNLGASLAKHSIVLILDDDAEADPDALATLRMEWEKRGQEPGLAGIGGLITNLHQTTFLEKLFRAVFLLKSDISWDVTDVGFQVWDPSVSKPVQGHFVTGGTASFRKDVLKQIPFRQRGEGRSPGEDTEFFWMAKKEGLHFWLHPGVRFRHRESPVSRESERERGFKEGANQKAIFKEHGSSRKTLKFYWSMTGWILRQALRGRFARAMGMTKGVFS